MRAATMRAATMPPPPCRRPATAPADGVATGPRPEWPGNVERPGSIEEPGRSAFVGIGVRPAGQ